MKKILSRLFGIGRVMETDPAALDLNSVPDAFAHYERLRVRGGPVQYVSFHDAYLVLGYDEVSAALSNPEIFPSRPCVDVDAVLFAATPPPHAAIRRAVARHFSADTIDRIALGIPAHAASLLHGEVDLATGYATPISESVAAQLIGFNLPDLQEITRVQADAPDFPALKRTLDEIAERSAVYQQLLDTGIDDPTARSLVSLLWLASTRTVQRAITRSALRLLQHPDVRASVAANLELVDPFVDEVLRLDPPEYVVVREAAADTELGGLRIPRGTTIYLSLAAANRDPAKFRDASTLDLARTGPEMLTFGHGLHRWIGAALARRTVVTSTHALLTAAPAFHSARPLGEIRYSRSLASHTIEYMPVATGVRAE